ncbi:glucan phosphoethanolaminetransferase (alkaline phosphatase superfamily) [Pedobacter africanus]|uniref:Glucan phosphoethanolaminetransferase (Alkaline phosphatase superfamily) n=1 Tax=Pedobacter africanus TaxID=151894 RepID=A0ACC6KSL0_9SPHI|nr:hypothetical protein [Pedobacter africanus]MDR6782118.1 glucan phosphoethanolaminetransferase (alkaline phosphatase superfamily) [Pedobacter africanus]
MYTSKFKLLLHWLGIVIGFYVFWALSYLILAKFATSQFNRFQYTKQSLWTELTASDIFWYIMFIFGIILTIYVIHMLIRYSPHRKAAALVFAFLIVISVGVLLDKLLETSSGFSSLPHIFINAVFLISIVYAFFKAEQPPVRNEEDYLEDGEE